MNDKESDNTWSVQKFKKNDKRNIVFFHHKTRAYFVIYDFEKSDSVNIKSIFIEGLIDEMHNQIQINEYEKKQLKIKIKDIKFHEFSNNNIANGLFRSIIFKLKFSEMINSLENKSDVKEFYNQHESSFFNENYTELKDILLK